MSDNIIKKNILLSTTNASIKITDVNIGDDVLWDMKIKAKPELISTQEKTLLGDDINLVKLDRLKTKMKSTNKAHSPMLINYVEPYINGDNVKICFYTEVDSKIKKGDKVFIVNGYYDNNVMISHYKYRQKRDGYDVLYVDKCKIVLDLDYNKYYTLYNNKVYNVDKNYTNVYVVNSYMELITMMRWVIGIVDKNTGRLTSKFNKNDYLKKNSSIFYINVDLNIYNIDYNKIDGWNFNINKKFDIGNNNIIKNGFYYYDNNKNGFVYISTERTISNIYGSLKIVNGDFVFNNKLFRKGFVYKYLDTNSGYNVDITYLRPYIGHSNFRCGYFSGTWNDGIFGQYNKMIHYYDNNSLWNNGALLNTIWLGGTITSTYNTTISYYTDMDNNGIPHIKDNVTNNNGRGYNYIKDSIIMTASIYNGSFYDTILCDRKKNNENILRYEKGESLSYSVNINKGYFNNCYINDSYVENADIKRCYINDTIINKSNINNSHLYRTYTSNSNYNCDDTIKINDFDEYDVCGEFYDIDGKIKNGITHKVYKFYIDEKSYSMMNFGDTFYLKGIKINDNSIMNIFDKRFILNSWDEYVDCVDGDSINKYRLDCSAFLMSNEDNNINFYNNGVISKNKNSHNYSIDIWVTLYNNYNNYEFGDNHFKSNGNYKIINYIDYTQYDNKYNKLNSDIDITNAYIINGDYNSGHMRNCVWNSGHHIENNNDNLLYNTKLNENIITANHNQLIISELEEDITDTIQLNDIVYINAIKNDNNDSVNDSYIITTLPSCTEYSTMQMNSIQNTATMSGDVGNTYSRYYHYKKLKIEKSKVKSGLFKISYIYGSLIQNDWINVYDKDLVDYYSIKDLVISEEIFYNDNNLLSSAFYDKTFFINSNNWIKGIIYNSVWCDGVFGDGVIRNSMWINGVFNYGYFYKSKTFNENTTIADKYTDNNIILWHIDGDVNTKNCRYSWENGIFNGGYFINSDWECGTFNDGNFYYSNFYSGTINGGIIGNKTYQITDTNIRSAIVNNCVVENANFHAKNINNIQDYIFAIDWRNGIFNGGVFASDVYHACATFSNGTFNDGHFNTNAKWQYGIFNGGAFLSAYGDSNNYNKTFYNITSSSDCYAWDDGIFNGGNFGNGDAMTNSSWRYGIFNGGIFKGRLWYDGIFKNGDFYGSGLTASGKDECDKYYVEEFVNSYKNKSYYGWWYNGYATNLIYDSVYNNIIKKVNMYNVLWCGGTFSHQGSSMNNCVWLDGSFDDGNFINSSFNPFVERFANNSKSFNTYDTCVWHNGVLKNSDFYISKWYGGTFDIGDGYGMIWLDGVCEYMNAYNIFWENGDWRNGNWNGAYFNWDGITPSTTTMDYAILDNIHKYTSENHPQMDNYFIWDIFLNHNTNYTFTTMAYSASDCNSFIFDDTITIDNYQPSAITTTHECN